MRSRPGLLTLSSLFGAALTVLTVSGAALSLGACSDDATTTDSGATDMSRRDGPAADTRAADGPGGDARAGDGLAADSASPDARRSDGAPADQSARDGNADQGARDGGGGGDASGSSSLTARIDAVYAWANLQPIVAPDPTHATITLELKNSGSGAISAIAISAAEIASTKAPLKTHTLAAMKPIVAWNGTLAAGATVSIQFQNTPSGVQTPVAFGCNDKVELSMTLTSSSGAVGPLKKTTTFNCVY